MDSRESAAVWGDSKADAIYPALVRASTKDARWMEIGRVACAPVTGLRRISLALDDGGDCAKSNRVALNMLIRHPEIKNVVITSAFRVLYKETYAQLINLKNVDWADVGILHSIRTSLENGKKVSFLIDNPALETPLNCVHRKLGVLKNYNPGCKLMLEEHQKRTAEMTSLAARIKEQFPNVLVFDPAPFLCDMKNRVCLPSTAQDQYPCSYTDHLSDFGADQFAPELLRQIEKHSPVLFED